MKSDISRERKEAIDKLVERMKLQQDTVSAKKGCEKLYRFNEDVKDIASYMGCISLWRRWTLLHQQRWKRRRIISDKVRNC